jgi:SLT domain-containing protein
MDAKVAEERCRYPPPIPTAYLQAARSLEHLVAAMEYVAERYGSTPRDTWVMTGARYTGY